MAYFKQFISLILIIAGLFGFYFFKNYEGSSIPYPSLWMICSIGLGLIGLFSLFHYPKVDSKLIEKYEEEIRQVKAKSEKITIEIDKCEFTNTGYFKEIKVGKHDWMARVLFTDEIQNEEHIHQSGLIYQTTSSSGLEKFYSPAFPFDKTTLQFYVLNKKVKLYIDRFNRDNYFFEVEK